MVDETLLRDMNGTAVAKNSTDVESEHPPGSVNDRHVKCDGESEWKRDSKVERKLDGKRRRKAPRYWMKNSSDYPDIDPELMKVAGDNEKARVHLMCDLITFIDVVNITTLIKLLVRQKNHVQKRFSYQLQPAFQS